MKLPPIYVRTMVKMQFVLEDEEGATLVEYALVLAMIAVIAMASVQLIGGNILKEFNLVAGNIAVP